MSISNKKSQEKVGMMYSGVAEDKQTIGYLKRIITAGIDKGSFSEGDGELLAQIIWASTFGLLSRLIIENKLSDEQRGKLIKAHIEFMLSGFKK